MAKLGGASGDARYALTPEDIKKIPGITAGPDSILPIKGQKDFYLVRHDGGVTYRLRVEPQGDSLVAKELTREPAAPDVNVINGENPEFTFPETNGKIYEDAERTAPPKTPDRNYNEPDIGSERNIEGAGDVITEIRYRPSSGANLKATPGKTTTILGNYDKDMKHIINEMGNVKSTDIGPNNGGFNVLNIPDKLYKHMEKEQFWETYNKPWLNEAINRGDDIVLATVPESKYLSYIDKTTGKKVITGFGREYDYLVKRGYVYDATANKMILR